VYRVLYEIHDDVLVVCVVKVGHRREAEGRPVPCGAG
jgi:mRNA-degrading endonuclease RelE of RelBE toxin-antitoxin system